MEWNFHIVVLNVIKLVGLHDCNIIVVVVQFSHKSKRIKYNEKIKKSVL